MCKKNVGKKKRDVEKKETIRKTFEAQSQITFQEPATVDCK